ncbi:hypothetical protein Btru_074649 [Bulinus truncatus]|nr:hypothetical protein Btru_074649 [Bulinus truncatus]
MSHIIGSVDPVILQKTSPTSAIADKDEVKSSKLFPHLYHHSPSYQRDTDLPYDDDLEEDEDMDSGGGESKKSNDFQNSARMDLWKRLSDWMDRVSENYARGQPKLFERLSRGRLDRMPLSYGKRSAEDILPFQNSEVKLRNIRERLSRPPVYPGKTSSNTKEVPADKTSDIFLEPYLKKVADLPQSYKDEILKTDPTTSVYGFSDPTGGGIEKRDRLNRMPISFGKRNWDDFFNAIQYNRIPRGRFDRMPLTFGKRGDKRNMFINCLKEKSSSPFAFALEGEDVFLRCSETKVEEETLSPALNERSMNHDDWSRTTTLALDDGWAPLVRVRRSRLGRMPVSFGKRTDAHPWQGIDDDVMHGSTSSDQVKVHGRSSLPFTYGKRLDSTDHLGRYSKRNWIDRMPLNFGKSNNLLLKEIATIAMDVDNGPKNQVYSHVTNQDVDNIGHQNIFG